MTLKQRVFKALAPFSKFHNLFLGLAIVQTLITTAMPFIWHDIETAHWLLSLSLLSLWLSSFAILKVVHAHSPERSGLKGWFANGYEALLFWVWLLVVGSVAILFLKVVVWL